MDTTVYTDAVRLREDHAHTSNPQAADDLQQRLGGPARCHFPWAASAGFTAADADITRCILSCSAHENDMWQLK